MKQEKANLREPRPVAGVVAARPVVAATTAQTRVAFARAIETTADGKAPHAVRLWKAGINYTDKGPVDFTRKSADLVMKAYAKRGNPLVFDYEHETLLPLEKRGGSPMRGAASAPQAVLEVRADENGEPELWASSVGWTAEAQRQIESGERRQISPVSNFNKSTREVTEIINVALCIEGATHEGTLLASAAKGKAPIMDELIQKICDAAAAQDWETVEALTAQAKAAGSGDMSAAMPAVAAAKPPVPPMAASRDDVVPVAYSRAVARMEAATLDSKRTNVEMLIATSRDCFDAVDEKEHIAAADPTATRKHIASVKRKVEAGTIAASRAVAESGAKPPGAKVIADESHGLDVTEIMAASRLGVTPEEFANAKARNTPARKGN